ncbi:hypothetical protein ACFYPW_32250 [Micromonospora zamorensis]|uniref:hypothetical protein n=1 Tax=Micromonospora zamorensis TaxID=709883 RepID=UPI0036AAE665
MPLVCRKVSDRSLLGLNPTNGAIAPGQSTEFGFQGTGTGTGTGAGMTPTCSAA